MTTYTTIPDSDIDPESPITSTLITRLRDNAIAIGERDSSVPAALLLFGGLISHTTIINTNATWTPNAATNRIVVMIVGGGGGGGYIGQYEIGTGGLAGAVRWGEITGVTGTYSAIIGGGGSGTQSYGNDGIASSFDGISAAGGYQGSYVCGSSHGMGGAGQSCVGVGGAPSGGTGYNAPNNSGAGGGGGRFYFPGGSGRSSCNGGSGIIYVWEFA